MSKCEDNQQDRPTNHMSGSPDRGLEDKVYRQTLNRIAQLEDELRHKDKAFATLMEEQKRLRERLQSCIQTMQKTSNQLTVIGSEFRHDFSQLHHRIAELEQENKALQEAIDVWSHRAINREFDVLTVQAENKKMKGLQDLAASIMELQEIELTIVNTENHRLLQQSGQNEKLAPINPSYPEARRRAKGVTNSKPK